MPERIELAQAPEVAGQADLGECVYAKRAERDDEAEQREGGQRLEGETEAKPERDRSPQQEGERGGRGAETGDRPAEHARQGDVSARRDPPTRRAVLVPE